MGLVGVFSHLSSIGIFVLDALTLSSQPSPASDRGVSLSRPWAMGNSSGICPPDQPSPSGARGGGHPSVIATQVPGAVLLNRRDAGGNDLNGGLDGFHGHLEEAQDTCVWVLLCY